MFIQLDNMEKFANWKVVLKKEEKKKRDDVDTFIKTVKNGGKNAWGVCMLKVRINMSGKEGDKFKTLDWNISGHKWDLGEKLNKRQEIRKSSHRHRT